MRRYDTWIVPILVPLIAVAVACGTEETDFSPQQGVDPTVGTTALTPEAPDEAATQTVVQTHVPTEQAETSDPTPGIAEDAACDGRIMSSSFMFNTIGELAWSSHQIVVATVTEILPAARVTVEGSALPFTIVRDVSVSVEEQYRGQPADVLWVRLLGGSIGSCSQEFPDSPQLETGDRVLLFLREIDGGEPIIHEILGSAQGHWSVSSDERASTQAIHLLPEGVSPTLETIAAAIVDALADAPPQSNPILSQMIVPVEESPIGLDIDIVATATP